MKHLYALHLVFLDVTKIEKKTKKTKFILLKKQLC